MLAALLDVREGPAHVLGDRSIRLVEDQLVEAQDGVHGCAQLVAHVREEVGLVAARRLQLAALIIQLLEEARVVDGNPGLVGESAQ